MVSLADQEGWIWFDGELVPWQEARVHVLTHTLHYGLGVFEGVRAYNTPSGPCIFRLYDHTDRLFDSAHIMRMKLPFSKTELNDAQKLVIRENGLKEGYLRPVCFLGSESMGLRASDLSVHVAVAAWEWPNYMDQTAKEKGIRVRTSSYTRHNINSTMCKAKANGNYINSLLALQEAIDSGCDEAMLLDNENYVAEGSGENVFMVYRGQLHTPTLTSCLRGITRDTIIAFAKELGIPVIERQITRDELYIADELFFTGTAAEVLPIREVDGRTIGDGKRGELTAQFQTMYFNQIHGERNQYPHWQVAVND